LIADYMAMIDEFWASLEAHRLPVALKLAALPQEIRGFGHVKERNMAAAQITRERLLSQYRKPAEVALEAQLLV
jgi:indolepyruvate ferredoxin oxidoreductase